MSEWIDIIVVGATLFLALSKNISLAPTIFILIFIGVDSLYSENFLLSLSLSVNGMLLFLFLDKNDNIKNDIFFDIIKNNKRHFPFNNNVLIVISKAPYAYLYLKEGKVIRLRGTLKELLVINPYLKKITRNTAISTDVDINQRDHFIVDGQNLTAGMIVTWGKQSNQKNDSQI